MRALATRTIPRARRLFARAFAAVVALVMLVGVLRAGARYSYCPTMKMIADAPCCAGDRRPPQRQQQDVATVQARARDCCEKHVVGSLPSGAATVTAPHLLAAPLVAVLPAKAANAQLSLPDTRARFDHEGRAGPRASARHRAELMVFLN